jgi:hypothetical protein
MSEKGLGERTQRPERHPVRDGTAQEGQVGGFRIRILWWRRNGAQGARSETAHAPWLRRHSPSPTSRARRSRAGVPSGCAPGRGSCRSGTCWVRAACALLAWSVRALRRRCGSTSLASADGPAAEPRRDEGRSPPSGRWCEDGAVGHGSGSTDRSGSSIVGAADEGVIWTTYGPRNA